MFYCIFSMKNVSIFCSPLYFIFGQNICISEHCELQLYKSNRQLIYVIIIGISQQASIE
jgi:hypothetical protein